MALLLTPRIVGLIILAASVALAGMTALRDPRAPGLSFAVLGWGMVAAAVAIGLSIRTAPPEPMPARLARIRGAHDAAIGKLQSAAASAGVDDLTSCLREGLVTLDEEIIPALRQLMARETEYTEHLTLYESGELPTPDPGVLQHLHTSHARQRQAIESSIQGLSTAEARLFSLAHQPPSPNVAGEVDLWLRELASIHRSLAEALRSPNNAVPPLVSEVQPAPPTELDSALQRPSLTDEDRERFTKVVQQALHHLNKPSALAHCELVGHLRRTIEATRASWSTGPLSEATPLEEAQALRAVLNSAMDRLRPAGDAESTAPQYQILHREYREGMQTSHIATRLSVSSATLFRWRADAVKAIAEDLLKREEALAAVETPPGRDRSFGTAG
jgi:hypothetical protein